MATQCRSSKCTAERKGFRRELDSWRHKLIHCVGFESILQGIYGPRLLRDLSIFDDCEPDVVNDWSVDASCSFCNLQLEKIGDHIATVCSLQSTPTEETPPQGQSNTEKIEYQADKFLHAIFRSKDLPQSCDPNIPLVAQELMKKMIRQFAIEYASKSQIQGGKNGSSMDVHSVCDSLQLPPDEDGPLDLTVNRNHLNVEQDDGVLDLSKKNCASSAALTSTTVSTNQKSSGSLVPAGEHQVHLDIGHEQLEVGSTALEMVFSSLCPYHKMLLYHILKFMHEDYGISVSHCREPHRHFSQKDALSCHLGKKSCEDVFGFNDYKTSYGCYVHSCRLNTYSMTPVCICLKNLQCLSCQSIAIGCINKVIGQSSCGCCAHLQSCPGSCQRFNDTACIAPAGNLTSPFSSQKACDSYNPCIRGCSPSPPPLSPIPSDINVKIGDKNLICPFLDGTSLSHQPPSLFPDGEEEVAFLHRDNFNKEGASNDNRVKKTADESTDCCLQTRRHFEHLQSGTLFQDLMARINEKFKTIEPLEKEPNLCLSANQNLACSNDHNLGKIITNILHNESGNDYNLKELLHPNESIIENKPIQTRFRRKQEALAAIINFPFSRQQIKRELASFDSPFCRRRQAAERVEGENSGDYTDTQSFCTELLPVGLEMEETSEDGKDQGMKDISGHLTSPATETELLCGTSENKEDAQKGGEKGSSTDDTAISVNDILCETSNTSTEPFQPSTESGRSRRNIVPPQRFSAYVTEPRKMYFAACFSESIFRPSKDKALVAVTCDENSCSSLNGNKCLTELQVQKESTRVASYSEGQSEDEHICDQSIERNLENVSRSDKWNQSMQAEEKSGECGTKQNSQRRTKRNEATSRSLMPLLISQDQKHNVDPENSLSEDVFIKEASVPNESHLVSHYTSPIRLMFVSPVVGEEGIKYTLKSAVSGSTSQGEIFDPCEESSWCGTTKAVVEEVDGSSDVESLKTLGVRGDENNLYKKAVPTDASRSSGPLNKECENQKETCPLIHGMILSLPKRRPGRPKKLRPQVEKPAKRPIGRPPKHKVEDCVPSFSNSSVVTESIKANLCDEDGRTNKNNLKITVVYGRSRRIKRVVSEGNGHFREDQHMKGTECTDDHEKKCELNAVGFSPVAVLSDKLPEGKSENFNFVTPAKDRICVPHPNRIVKCPKHKCSSAMRKPGRPPKVKISGISVTVTTVSPKQRKIHMNRDVTESHDEMSQQAKPFNSVYETPKEQTTIDLQSDAISEEMENVENGMMNQKTPVPLRHSARVRKPSIHLLHSVATSRAFTRSNELLQRSRKLLLNKANSEPKQTKSPEMPVQETLNDLPSEKPTSHLSGQDLSIWSEASVDSIFTSDEAFRWWPASASAEALNEEFARRIQLMSDTWIPEAVESSSTDRQRNKLRMHSNDIPKNSAVKMLFQKHCNMDKLCAWFMKTTETQSLAIVKKASTRNPYEIVQYSSIRATNRVNVCPSPQAERLRKHLKKFAKIVPKSPAMHRRAQQKMASIGRLHVKRRLFLPRSNSAVRSFDQRCLWSRSKVLGKYGITLLSVKSKLMSRKRFSNGLYCHLDVPMRKVGPGTLFKNASTLAKGLKPPQTTPASSTMEIEQHSMKMDVSGERTLTACQAKNIMDKTDTTQEEILCSKTWSPETLKECRVFLKKINSPETKSTVEECNFCTVKLYDVSSSGYSSPIRKECEGENDKNKATETVKIEKNRRSPRISLPSHSTKVLWVHSRNRKGKRKSHVVSEPPPAKMARQSPAGSETRKEACDCVPGNSR